MWGAITQVTTGVTLVAFFAAIALSAYRFHLSGKARVIQSLPPAERIESLKRDLNAFGIDAKNLTKDQQFQLAMREIELRRARVFSVTIFVIIVAVVSGAIALFSIFGEKARAPEVAKGGGAPVEVSPPEKKIDAVPARPPTSNGPAPKVQQKPPEPEASSNDLVVWEKNWDAMRQGAVGMGSSAANECGYRNWKNRSRLVKALKKLDLKSSPEIENTRQELLKKIVEMPENCGSDEFYNLAISTEMDELLTDLTGAIRSEIIENHGKVQD